MRNSLKHTALLLPALLRVLLCMLFVSVNGSLLLSQEVTISLNVDYIVSGTCTVSPNGGSVTIGFMVNGGMPGSDVVLQNLQTQLTENAIEDWFTALSISEFDRYEGAINLTFSANLSKGEARSLTVTASSGEYVITQNALESAVYRVTPAQLSLFYGQSKAVYLSGSDSFATYRFLNDDTGSALTSSIQGTGRAISAMINTICTVSAVSDYPTEVDMEGTCSVTRNPFYSKRISTGFTTPYALNKNGDVVNQAFTISSADSTTLKEIIAFYNSGNSSIWNFAMQLHYSNNRLTISAPPNFSGVSVINNTYFKNSSGEDIVFSQAPGGELLQYEIAANQTITLNGSQFGVKYSLLRNDCDTIEQKTGNGTALDFIKPYISGRYSIIATYQGHIKTMKGIITITDSGACIMGDNWICKTVFTSATGDSSYLDITYYDGLGYADQEVAVKAWRDSFNLVNPVWYDNMLRDNAKIYLLYASESAMAQPDSAPFAKQQQFYSVRFGSLEEPYTFSENVFEKSPLNRVLRHYTPGVAFREDGGKYTLFDYMALPANELLNLKCSSNGEVIAAGYLPQNALFKQVTTTPDGRTNTKYTSSTGLLFMEKAGNQETYYIYDDKLQLRKVLQPKGSNALKERMLQANGNIMLPPTDTLLQLYAYQYNYNGKGELIEKQLPGRGVQHYIYDPAGRGVALQNALQRDNGGRWLLTKYNAFDEIEKQYLSDSLALSEIVSSFAEEAYPTTIYNAQGNTLLLQNTYGKNSATSGLLAFAPVNDIISSNELTHSTTGLLINSTALSLPTLFSQNKLYNQTTYYYDSLGRVVQTVALMPNGELLRGSSKYDFTNKPIVTESSCTINNKEEKYRESFTYNGRGVLLSASFSYNGGAKAKSKYSYNALGQLSGTQYFNATSPLINQTYAYNIQQWPIAQTAKNGDSNIYSQTLRYYNPLYGTPPSYDGNITECTYNTSTYGFIYDASGRLIESNRYIHGQSSVVQTVTFTERDITYDSNGNILTLRRFGADTVTPKDNFRYNYVGNIISSISGSYNGASLSNATYGHDLNGNTIRDGLRGLDLSYDLICNMLQSIYNASDNANIASYTYFADGSKYMVKNANGYGRVYLGAFAYDIGPGKESPNDWVLGEIDFSTGEGRFINSAINATAPNFETTFFVKDRLGSVRAVVNANNQVVSRNSYYPFGLRIEGDTLTFTPAKVLLYNSKELQNIARTNYLDFGARMYDPTIARWTTQDAITEQFMSISPYAYCLNNPITLSDPAGLDTMDVKYNDKSKVWELSKPILAEGDDIFRLTKGEDSWIVPFTEGEYGKRINMLNIEITENYTLGAYQISGSNGKGAYGVYYAPGGESSNTVNSGKRVDDGVYDLQGHVGEKWSQLKLIGNGVDDRNILIHSGGKILTEWSKGCFAISSDYIHNGHTIEFDKTTSVEQLGNFDFRMGAIDTTQNRRGRYRNIYIRATFNKGPKNLIDKKAIVKTWKNAFSL